MFFRLDEYRGAELRFVGGTIEALARARGGIVSEIKREPTDRISRTQITTDEGTIVEFEPFEVRAPIRLRWEDISEGRIDALLAALDAAAEAYHESLTTSLFQHIEHLTAGTGLQVDASGRDFFDAYYEMLEGVDVPFESDGSISPSFAMVAHPETAETIKKAMDSFTSEQQKKLNDLLERKRLETFARRRTRRLS